MPFTSGNTNARISKPFSLMLSHLFSFTDVVNKEIFIPKFEHSGTVAIFCMTRCRAKQFLNFCRCVGCMYVDVHG